MIKIVASSPALPHTNFIEVNSVKSVHDIEGRVVALNRDRDLLPTTAEASL